MPAFRQAPPRGRSDNPEDAAPSQPPPAQPQVHQIPVLPIVITTLVTTATGLAITEIYRLIRASLQRRWDREAQTRESQLNPSPQEAKIGTQNDGSFRLPGPNDFGRSEVSQVHYGGFAQPVPHQQRPADPRPAAPQSFSPPAQHRHGHLVDVSTPDGHLEHRVGNLERELRRANENFERLYDLASRQSEREAR